MRENHTTPIMDAHLVYSKAPDVTKIDETQLKILSIITKARAGALARVRVTVGARGPVSGAKGLVLAGVGQKESEAGKGVEKGDELNVRNGEAGSKEESKSSAKAKKRRRNKEAARQRVSTAKTTTQWHKEKVTCHTEIRAAREGETRAKQACGG